MCVRRQSWCSCEQLKSCEFRSCYAVDFYFKMCVFGVVLLLALQPVFDDDDGGGGE